MGSRQRQRRMYETAFDSKTYTSRDATQLDAMANHTLQRSSPQFPHNPVFCGALDYQKCGPKRLIPVKDKESNFESSMDSLNQHFVDFDITGRSALLDSYSSASTCTIPLPPSVSSRLNCDSFDNSAESPSPANRGRPNNLLVARAPHCQSPNVHGDIRNPNNNNNQETEGININKLSRHLLETQDPPCYYNGDNNRSPSNPVRPRSCQATPKILEIKSRPERSRGKSSSTESMTTSSSSSAGSLESIRSSASDGNRSTTSTDSRRSGSVSSYNSSDSAVGSGGFPFTANFTLGNRFLNQAKFHVLSPISDKSSQELPSESSELSDANRHCNSSAGSPDETKGAAAGADEEPKRGDSAPHKTNKKRPLPIRNVDFLNDRRPLGDTEGHQGSDSGISMESSVEKAKLPASNDFSDLPFDMPKLRRRRLQQMQSLQSWTQDTSSSATSVDLKNLPFDMPKLRRKLRSFSGQESDESAFHMNNLATSALGGDQTGKCHFF